MSAIPLEMARLMVSEGALLSPARAAKLLGFRGARQWIEDNVPIRLYAGRPRVRWGDVVAATDAGATTATQAFTPALVDFEDF